MLSRLPFLRSQTRSHVQPPSTQVLSRLPFLRSQTRPHVLSAHTQVLSRLPRFYLRTRPPVLSICMKMGSYVPMPHMRARTRFPPAAPTALPPRPLCGERNFYIGKTRRSPLKNSSGEVVFYSASHCLRRPTPRNRGNGRKDLSPRFVPRKGSWSGRAYAGF